ncbi:MAG: ABC transporter permease [Phycisphaerae bacterium]|nr:ABC transporter permease [Gemmatimonadaceae bacterium]
MRSEVHAHIEARVEYLVARGVAEDKARRDARRRFGENFEAAVGQLELSARSRTEQLNRRERLALIAQDARFVLRGLARAPAFTAGVIATFAIGLGINSAVFRVADRVLARAPDGVTDPWSLRRVHTVMSPAVTVATEGNAVSFPEARIIADSRSFASLALYIVARNLREHDGPELAGVYVDSGFFHTLGAQPASGRFFDVREAAVGADQAVAVVSFDYWQQRMGGVPLTREHFVTINERKYQIVGATARGFNGVDLDPVQIWLPLGMAVMGRATLNGVVIPWYQTTMFRGVHLVARVRRDANDEVEALRANLAITAQPSGFGGPVKALVLRSIVSGGGVTGSANESRMLTRLSGVAFIVLLIGCANAANLLLARALRRRPEIAIRLALGASRLRIARLLIIESVALGIGGGLAGTVAGYWTGTALRQLIFPQAKWVTPVFDERALFFTFAVALIAGAIAGLAPALQLTNPSLTNALKDSRQSAGGRSHATRATLVVLQTALSLGLIIVSGLLVRSMQRLNAVDIGFGANGLVTAEIAKGFSAPAALPVSEAVELLSGRMQRDRRVQGVALSSNAPFGSFASTTVSVPGEPEADISARDGPWYSAVSANFFTVMSTRVVSGRAFNSGDGAGSSPVAIVNESMAKVFWQDGNPYRSCLLMLGTCARIVGVVQDIRETPSGSAAAPRYYLPLAQHEIPATAVIVRTQPEHASAVATTIKGALPATQRMSLEIVNERVGRALRPWQVATLLFGALGVVALVLACIGVYSVISYLASERRHEIGVRIALGASAMDIVQLVLQSGIRLVAMGAVVGLAAAALSTRFLASLLFGISALDPVVYVISVASLLLVGTVAAFVPALRVIRTDPTTVLRAE